MVRLLVSVLTSIDTNTLNPSKYRAAELLPLKNEITARQSFISGRIVELEAHFGSITQDPANGNITAATGFYGNRFRFIDMRINLMSGSLSKLKNFEAGQDAQDQLKNANANTNAALSSVVVATQFRAPSTGIEQIHILDPSGFSPGDSVFIVANEQPEISTTIVTIDNTRIVLADKIPKKYRETDLARLYKVL